MQNDRNYPMVGSPSISKSHVGPGIQQKPRIWTLFSLINLWILHKSVPPAPRPRRGCPAPAPAGRGTPDSKNFYKYKIFLRIFTVAPCKNTGDHRQIMGIMGRSWAVSRVFQNYGQIVPNPYIITSAEVVPRNRGGPLRTWPLLIVILRISSTHFLQRVRVKNSKSGARARASFFK